MDSGKISKANLWLLGLPQLPFAVRRVAAAGDGITACCDRTGPLRLASAPLREVLTSLPCPPRVHSDLSAAPFGSSALPQDTLESSTEAGNFCLALEVCGEHVWCGWSSGHVAIVNVATKEMKAVFYAHRGAVHCLAGSGGGGGGGHVLSASSDRTMLLWDAASQQVLRSLSAAIQQSALTRTAVWGATATVVRTCVIGDDAGAVKAIDVGALGGGGHSGNSRGGDGIARTLVTISGAAVRAVALSSCGALWAGGDAGALVLVLRWERPHARSGGAGQQAVKAPLRLQFGHVLAIAAIGGGGASSTAQGGGSTFVAAVGCADAAVVMVQGSVEASGGSGPRLAQLFVVPLTAGCVQLAPCLPHSTTHPMFYAVDRDGGVSLLLLVVHPPRDAEGLPLLLGGSSDDAADENGVGRSEGVTQRRSSRSMTAKDREASVRAIERRYEGRLQQLLAAAREGRLATDACEASIARSVTSFEALQRENEELRRECCGLTAALEESTVRFEALRRELSSADTQAADTISETIKLNAECSAQSRLIETMKADDARRRTQLEALHEQLAALDAALETRDERIAELEGRVKTERSAYEDALGQGSRMRDRHVQAERALTAAAERAAAAEARAEELERTLTAQAGVHARTEQQLEEQLNLVAELQRVNAALRARADARKAVAPARPAAGGLLQSPQRQRPSSAPLALAQQASGAPSSSSGARGVIIDM